MDHSQDTRVSVAHARFFKNHSPLISLLPSSHPTPQWISLQGPRFSEPNSITAFYTLPRTSSPHFSPIKHCRFPRQEVVTPAENSSEQLFFSVFPLSVSEPRYGNIRESRLMVHSLSMWIDSPHRLILHSFPVQYAARVVVGRTLFHSVIQAGTQASSIKWLHRLPGPHWVLCSQQAGEGRDRGTVGKMFYRAGLHTADVQFMG